MTSTRLFTLGVALALFVVVCPAQAQDAASWKGYQQLCQSGINVQCIRQGIQWLRKKSSPPTLKAKVYGHMAAAYIALNRQSDARNALVRMVELDPCQNRPPPTLPSNLLDFYKETRAQVLKQDQTPPVMTHTPLTFRQFREKGTFRATITENLKLRETNLYYRLKQGDTYTSIPLKQTGPTKFQVTLPAKLRQRVHFFQYYLEAVDCATRTSKTQADSDQPFEIFFQSKGNSGRTIGGAILIAVGSALILASPLTFLSANTELERWKATNDVPKSEEIRSNIILLHGLGWGGLGLGLTMGAIGTILVVTRPRKKLSPSVRALSLYPNEADHATLVRIPHINHRTHYSTRQ